MLVVIGTKGVDMSKEESDYLKRLQSAFPDDDFSEMFTSNDTYQITSVTPSPLKPTSIMLIFFFMNVMMNQKIRKFETLLARIPKIEYDVGVIKKQLEKEHVNTK